MYMKRVSTAVMSIVISTTAVAAEISKVPYAIEFRGTRTCGDISASVYRPFTTFRKIKLATAFFVNPELAEKSRIIYVYDLPNFVSQNRTDELWSGLKSGKIQLLLPTSSKLDSFASVPWLEFKSISESCDRVASTPAFPQLMMTINFQDKDAFRKSLYTLKPETIKDVRVVAAEDIVSGITANARLISWDPSEIFPISSEVK